MKVLVTGGAGYIGSHAVARLKEKGYSVVVVDDLSTGNAESLDPDVPFFEGSILNKAFLNRVFTTHTIDAVMHFAAYSQVGESVKAPLKYFKNNIGGTRTLLESMRENTVRTIIFSSTAAVYGHASKMPIDERVDLKPTNPYGETKRSIESLLNALDAADASFRYVSLRYFNVAGADSKGRLGELHDPETHLIPNVLRSVLSKHENLKVFGDDYPTPDGSAVRDYIHVEDLVDAHVSALKYLMDGNASDVFNLGSQKGYSVFDIIKTSEEVLERPIQYTVEKRREGDPPELIASYEKAKKILGWTPKHSLKAMIETAYRFYKDRGIL